MEFIMKDIIAEYNLTPTKDWILYWIGLSPFSLR